VVAGSAGDDGVPSFLIASDDQSATAQCKLDNADFTPCSGHYKPVASAGLHALTVRFTDAAGNASDQVLAFNVIPVIPVPPVVPPAIPAAPTPQVSSPSQPPKTVKSCKILGADGLTSGSLKIVSVSGSRRVVKTSLRSGSAAVARVDLLVDGRTLGSFPQAIRAGTSRLRLKLRSTPKTGSVVELAVRFYSVKREFGTARMSLLAKRSGLRRASHARSTLDTDCPSTGGASARPKLKVTSARNGARGFTLSSSSRRPGLVALRAYRSSTAEPVADVLFAVGVEKQKLGVKLSDRQRLARGSYKYSFESMSADGVIRNGRGVFSVH
jgi:hypothetical protein